MATTKVATSNGDLINWTLQVCNTSSTVTCFNVQLGLSIPSGILLTGPSDQGSAIIKVNNGVFNSTSKTWILGDLSPGQCYTQNFEVTVNDIGQAVDSLFTLQADLTSSCTETIITDNTDVLNILIQPCELVDLKIANSTESVDLSVGGTSLSSSKSPSSSQVPFSSAMPSSSIPGSSSVNASSSQIASSSVGQSSSNNGII